MNQKFDALTLGEIMLRFSPEGKERLSSNARMEKHAGGSELNVAAGMATLGLHTGVITKLPDNDLGRFVAGQISSSSVSNEGTIFDTSKDARLGIYYYESGAYPRKSSVIYDRGGSSFQSIQADEIFREANLSSRLFHTSGITLALCENTRAVAIETIKRMKETGAKISFDVNFRANLWTEEEARATIETILPMIDILFVSEETSRKMFQKTGEQYDIMKSYCTDFGVSIVAATERKIISPNKHNFGSAIYCANEDKIFTEESYKNIEVVDRIGSGDAYVAGTLFGLLKYNNVQKALQFGNAMSALKNTIPGDLTCTTYREIESLIKSHTEGGAESEMNR